VIKEGCPVSFIESEGDFGDFRANWKEIYSNVADGKLRFGDMELYQVGTLDQEAFESVSWDPVAAIEVARAKESLVQVLLEESAQVRG